MFMRKTNIKQTIAAMLIAAVSLGGGHTYGASIGVNFVSDGSGGIQNGDPDSLAPSELAGATGYAQTNWNNGGRWGGTVSVLDSIGNSGVTFTWDSPDVSNMPVNTYTNADGKLMFGYVDSDGLTNGSDCPYTFYGQQDSTHDNRPNVYVNGISAWLAARGATNYSIVIYSDSDANSNRIGEFWIQQPGDENDPPQCLGSDLTSHVFLEANNWTGFYTEVPLSANTAAAAVAGNYIVFTGLTNDSIVVRTAANFSDVLPRATISGIQIVPDNLSPFIDIQPQALGGALYAGQSFSLEVTAAGAPPLTYQWYQVVGTVTNFINGATNAAYSASNITTGDSGNYYVTISNSYGSTNSSVIDITVNASSAPMNAVVSPASASRGLGGKAILAVTANGSTPFTYQWYDGASALAGQTNSTLRLEPLQLADAGSYTCAVTNSLGGTVSSAGVLTVFSPTGTTIAVNFMDYDSQDNVPYLPVTDPAFGLDPTNWLNINAEPDPIGSTNEGPVSISWSSKNTWSQQANYSAYPSGDMEVLTGYLDDGVGATGLGPSATVSGLNSIYGAYVIRVASATDSGTGLLPVMITNDLSQLTFTNAGGVFGFAVPNGGNGQYGVSTVSQSEYDNTLKLQGGSGENGGSRGGMAGFIITDKPLIDSQPQGPVGTVYSGNPLSFSNIDVMGVSPLSFQWQDNGNNIPGATNTDFYSPATSGNYDVVVTNIYGSATSSVVAITVVDSGPINPTVNPASLAASVGGAVTFTVVAEGSTPFTYQWYVGSSVIAGGTNSTLTLTNVQMSNAGSYTCAVTNAFGGAISSPGTLTVNSSVPASVGINFGADEATVTAAAFGIDPANWFEAADNNGSGSMGSLNINWSASDIWQEGTTNPPGDNEVFYSYLDDGGSGPSATISGLAAMFPVYVVQTLGATDSGTSLENVTINGSQSLSYPSPQSNGLGGLTGESTISTPLYGDTLVIQGMSGLSGQARGGLAAVIITDKPIIENQPQAPTNVYLATSFSLTGLNVVGVPAISYQWQKGGTNITGATGAVYTQSNANTNDIGNYQVVVTNAFGSVTSSVVSVSAILPVPQILWSRSGDSMILNWSSGVLLEATNLLGPWTPNSAVPPYTVTPTEPQKFYRLQLQ